MPPSTSRCKATSSDSASTRTSGSRGRDPGGSFAAHTAPSTARTIRPATATARRDILVVLVNLASSLPGQRRDAAGDVAAHQRDAGPGEQAGGPVRVGGRQRLDAVPDHERQGGGGGGPGGGRPG